ncbi:MAG: hypothetical protein R3F55_18260 [Alphaproteobacteria bacterium]
MKARAATGAAAALLAGWAACAAAQEGGSMLTGPQTVQLTQSALTVLGHDPGPVDGAIGPQTRAALDAFAAASGLEIGWDGTVVDQGQALSLNVAAMTALGERLGHYPDGSYLEIALVPYEQTEDLLAGRIAFLTDAADLICADHPSELAELDGLIFIEPGQAPVVVAPQGDALLFLPRTGRWHEEAEVGRIVMLDADSFALQREGDNTVYARCLASPVLREG